MRTDLASLGWDAEFRALYARYDRPYHLVGRVSRVERGVCTTLTSAGPVRASLAGTGLVRAAADPTTLPCTGDWLVLRRWPDDRTTIEAVLPRRTAVVRAAAGREAVGQVLAANVDAVAVVEPMDPAPDLGRIERLLALAGESGAKPLVVLAKADLAGTVADAVTAQIAASVPATPVHAVSCVTGAGLQTLRPLIGPGRTLGLIGPSGAGKSSLVNALVGAAVMTTQTLRADGRGRHTTTCRALVPVPGGGAVIDTPGVRGIGLLTGARGLDLAFADVADLATRCVFVDCRHDREPGCAVLAALAAGQLPARRLESWRELRREAASLTRRRDARLRMEQVAGWRRTRREWRPAGPGRPARG